MAESRRLACLDVIAKALHTVVEPGSCDHTNPILQSLAACQNAIQHYMQKSAPTALDTSILDQHIATALRHMTAPPVSGPVADVVKQLRAYRAVYIATRALPEREPPHLQSVLAQMRCAHMGLSM